MVFLTISRRVTSADLTSASPKRCSKCNRVCFWFVLTYGILHRWTEINFYFHPLTLHLDDGMWDVNYHKTSRGGGLGVKMGRVWQLSNRHSPPPRPALLRLAHVFCAWTALGNSLFFNSTLTKTFFCDSFLLEGKYSCCYSVHFLTVTHSTMFRFFKTPHYVQERP